jgi:hypothetical protein
MLFSFKYTFVPQSFTQHVPNKPNQTKPVMCDNLLASVQLFARCEGIEWIHHIYEMFRPEKNRFGVWELVPRMQKKRNKPPIKSGLIPSRLGNVRPRKDVFD